MPQISLSLLTIMTESKRHAVRLVRFRNCTGKVIRFKALLPLSLAWPWPWLRARSAWLKTLHMRRRRWVFPPGRRVPL